MKRKLLFGLEASVGLAAVGGGVLLAAAPDGRLLAADLAVLKGTPFADYLVPGILLALLVGGGGLVAAALTGHKAPHAWLYGVLYATGVVAFEVVEYSLIGWQPLQAVIGALGLAILLLALTSRPSEVASRDAFRAI
ncbi:MAG: hypothetical protein JOZ75_14095 [Candidatus Dormibacteraeota bacterium]|nr:hypothetical protein [Candidatus Dormibacteraeota bacterium]